MSNRDLDACIAEHVMGWVFNRHGLTFSPQPDDKWAQEPRIPNYSTDLAAAMQVLEKCCELLPGGVHIKKRDSGDWIVSKREDIDPVWEVAETLELAIARFAFKLYGGKE